MQAVEIIRRKRDGAELTTEEIDWFISAYTREEIPDYQMSAWLMAVYWHGMSSRETSDLTLAMVRSGEELHVREIVSPVVDKHSTGGVGDKVTLAVVPLVAACGIAVGKMTGRGLGHTGGTIDKLESITGFRAHLSRQEFVQLLQRYGIVLAGQSNELAPADGKMYSLRDVTGTVESIPLIAASIMSKKLAIGASHLLLDVKVGNGAFMKTMSHARELAQAMVEIGRTAGMHTVAAITRMEQPLGHAVGNALELREALDILRGEGPQDITELCYHETAELLLMTGSAKSDTEAHERILRAVHSGVALEKFAQIVAAQGGDAQQIERPELLPQAPIQRILASPRSGYIRSIDSEQIGLASMHLGAGRQKKSDSIDARTGLVLQAKVGAYVAHNEPLVVIHARTEQEVETIQPRILACYQWSETPVNVEPLLLDVLHP